MHQSKFYNMMTSVFNECYMVNITTGVDFSITFQSRVEEPKESNDKAAVKYLMFEARSKGFNSKSLSVAEDQKKPYLWKNLKPDYCQSWTIFGELDSTSDVISAMNYLQSEESPIPATVSSVSQLDVSETNWSGVGSDNDLKLQSVLTRLNVNEVKPDGTEQAVKLETASLINISVSTNFTSGVKLDEEPQPDEAEETFLLRSTSNIVISECYSLSTIKFENTLVEKDGIYRCDHCQNEFSEFDKLRSHIICHFSENLDPKETPLLLSGTNDENFHFDCGIQEQTSPAGSSGVSEIHHSSRPIGSVNSRSCGVSAVAEIVNSSIYGQQNQESLAEAATAGYDASDKLVILDATFSNSVNTVMGTGDILLRCDHCQKQFLEMNRLRSHIIVHLNEGSASGAENKPFTCEFCNKSFSRSSNRLKHIRTHTGEKPFTCEFCDKRFAQSSSRDSHVRTHTGEKSFKCTFCDKRFAGSSSRLRHIRTHTGEKPFTCKFCEKRFGQTSARNAHVRTHSGEKSFTCDFCDKKFAQASTRNLHVRTHTGEKSFTCDFCDKRFAQATNRNKHVRTHTGEKSFTCDFCDKRFADSSARKVHVRTHTGEKPFACGFCPRTFASSSSRSKHMRVHAGDRSRPL